jgi:hypothetical protein
MDDSYTLAALLAADERQIPASLQLLASISPAGPVAISASWHAHQALLGRICAAQSSGGTLDDELGIAGVVASMCARTFRWAISDLLRGRTTAVYGYGRQQVEAVALVRLFRSQPMAAREWFNIRTDTDGRRFYGTYNPALMGLLEQMPGLREAYEQGSGQALHVRMAGVLRGFTVVRRDGQQPELILLDHEVGNEQQQWLLTAAAFFLCGQARILHELWRGFPEVSQDRFTELVVLAQAAGDFDAALHRSRHPPST